MNRLDFTTTDCEDLACHTGVTFIVDFLVIDDCTNIAQNLAGYTARMLIYDVTESTVIKSVSGTIATPATGVVSFEISATDTGALTVGMYSHFIELTISSRVYRIAFGNFEVSQ